jgi:protein ImuB
LVHQITGGLQERAAAVCSEDRCIAFRAFIQALVSNRASVAVSRPVASRRGFSAIVVDMGSRAAEFVSRPVVLSRSVQSEATTKAVLLECAGTFSPRVEDRSEPSAFLCGIDIAGTKSLFGPPEILARSLLQRVRALGICASVTVSNNLHAAASLAKGSSRRLSVQVIPRGREAATLSSLPLFVLDLTEKQAETFGLWGIRTLGMLAALPEKELIFAAA